MPFKSTLRAGLQALGRMPLISSLLFHPQIRRVAQTVPGFHLVYGRGWDLLHPFDCTHGTDTSGFVPPEELANSPHSSTNLHVYGGSQPSIICAALHQLPALADFTFVDLGCGKGRPVMVAATFPFREAIGVELSADLARTADINFARLRERTPALSPMRIVHGDAAMFPFPAGNLVVFLYNPFGEDVVRLVAANVESAIRSGPRDVFVIYYNPVHGKCFDAAPTLKRFSAETIPYGPDERGFGPDDADTVVIWHGGSTLQPLRGAKRDIRIVLPDYRAELAPE